MIFLRNPKTGAVHKVEDDAGYGAEWERYPMPVGKPDDIHWDSENGGPIVSLAPVEAILLNAIDQDARAALRKIITPGMEREYAAKEAEAREYLAHPAPKMKANWPILQPEAAARGCSLKALAEQIVSRADEVNPRVRAIHAARIAAKAKVRSLTSRAGKENAAAVEWSKL